jgi:hypothetical protein
LSYLEPQIILEIDALSIHVGEPFTFTWKFLGRKKLVTAVQIFLEAYGLEQSAGSGSEESLKSVKPTLLTSLKIIDNWKSEERKVTFTISEGSKPSMNDQDKEVYWVFRVLWETRKNREYKSKLRINVLPSVDAVAPQGEFG